MKKFVLKNSETGFQKAETRFLSAETRFQKAKTALTRIFFARNWMDSAQKKPDTIQEAVESFAFLDFCSDFISLVRN